VDPLFDEFGKDYTIIAPDMRCLGDSSIEGDKAMGALWKRPPGTKAFGPTY
jgi:hypothetical protein